MIRASHMKTPLPSPISRRRLLSALALAGVATLFSGEATARRGRGGREDGDDDDHPHHHDYDQARQAVETGEALPLSDIMAEVRKVIDGDILDVELLREGPEITYRIRMLSQRGTYHQIFVNAKTKTILKIEQQ